MHVRPTPRVGGVGVFIALIASIPFAPEHLAGSYAKYVTAASVLFLAGLSEDLGWRVSPKQRLLAAAVSGLLVVVLLDVWAPRLGLPYIDPLMESGVLGIPLTLFAVVGLSNAFNLIDGVNGLAGFTALFAIAGMGVVAWMAGYNDVVPLLAMFGFAVSGFLILNFPLGLIFLGDAGAYTIGFALGWFAVAIIMNAPEVSAWAMLLMVFWPVLDTFLAIYRRSLRQTSTMLPDRLHVHQLVMRTLEISVLGRDARSRANPLTTVVLAPFVILPVAVGLLLWDQPMASMAAFFGLIAMYFGGYFLFVRLVRNGVFKRVNCCGRE